MNREDFIEQKDKYSITLGGVTYPLTNEEEVRAFCKAAGQYLKPCPFCAASAQLQQVERPTSTYWLIRCDICGVEKQGILPSFAIENWNGRPKSQWIPLGEHSYELPGGQPFQQLIVHGNGKYTFVDWMDEGPAKQFDVNLGRFRISVYAKGAE